MPENPYQSPMEVNEAWRFYTHARQFPHLAGMADTEIRALARRAMERHPKYRTIMRVRNVVVLGGMGMAILGLELLPGWGLGHAMAVSGAVTTLAILAWNTVWVNTVMFRITKEQAQTEGVPQK